MRKAGVAVLVAAAALAVVAAVIARSGDDSASKHERAPVLEYVKVITPDQFAQPFRCPRPDVGETIRVTRTIGEGPGANVGQPCEPHPGDILRCPDTKSPGSIAACTVVRLEG